MNNYTFTRRLLVVSLIQCLAFVLSVEARADMVNPFTFATYNGNINSIKIDKVYTSTDIIYPFVDVNSVSGLAINGTITLQSNTSIVRVVLEDSNGTQYLVSETCRLFEPSDTINLRNYCEETFSLSSITPVCLKVSISDASLHLDNISYTQNKSRSLSINPNDSLDIRVMQIQKKVDAINKYNQANNKLWYADVTPRSMLSYERKKQLYGSSDDSYYSYGIEYYGGGIIEIGEPQETMNMARTANTSPYIDSFDWRNRHGKNWVTPVKHQGDSGYCVAFAVNSILESYANLYYNDLINLDLSEMDIVYNYARDGYKQISAIYRTGMNSDSVFKCIIKNGVIDETSEPFIDETLYTIPQRKEGSELIEINSYKTIKSAGYNQDSIKKALINHGPLTGSLYRVFGRLDSHIMSIVGYKTIHAGDTVRTMESIEDGSLSGMNIIQENDERIGKTCWIFKDSYGTDEVGRIDGFMYVVFNDVSRLKNVHYMDSAITTRHRSTSDIQCTDEDGDGFYFWGLGERPAHCPVWAPYQPDGDDSDSTLGPLNEYGYCIPIDPNSTDSLFTPIYIMENTLWDNYKFYHQHIIVDNSATLTVSSDTDFYKGVTIYLNNGATLIVDGATLNNVKIQAESGSKIVLKNNSTINYCPNSDFSLPLGAELEIIHGVIN